MSNCGSPKNSVPPPSSSPTSERSSTPDRRRARARRCPVSSALPSSESRKVSSARRSDEVEQRQPLLVGVAEDERRGSAPASRWRRAPWPSSCGPKSETVGAHGHARPDAAEREELDREAGGPERHAELGGALGRRARRDRRARRGPRQVALDVGDEHRHAGGRQLLGDAPAASSSCRCRSRRRSGRGGSSSRSGSLTTASGTTAPSWTPRPRSTAAPSTAYAVGDRLREVGHPSP